jgi:hypothetical protein
MRPKRGTIAREAGFDVTADDFKQFAQQLAENALCPDELEQVSGGLGGDDNGSFLRPQNRLKENILKTF